MKKAFLFTLLLCALPYTAYGQFFDYEEPEVRIKSGMPNVFSVDNVRKISDRSGEALLNINVSVKKGRILSVSRDSGFWVVTVRTSGRSASTYVINERKFRIIGDESKKVVIHAIHWKDGK